MNKQSNIDSVNLIAISGKIGSGKDIVGKIIQYLTSKSVEKGRTFEQFLERSNNPEAWGDWYYSDWEIKKFADSLKEVAAVILGVKRERFEDQEFKKSLLPEEWGYWTFFSHVEMNGEKYSVTPEHGRFLSKEEAEERMNEMRISMRWSDNVVTGVGFRYITVRQLLQEVGTELFRFRFHPNTWVNSLFSNYSTDDKWIITDMRFKNEMKRVKELGGITIRVNRKGLILSNHSSEVELENEEFDYVIDNNSDINTLIESVKNILLKIENSTWWM